MKQKIKQELDGKKILILGFGREGKSSYSFIKENVEYAKLAIADRNAIANSDELEKEGVILHIGEDYLNYMKDYDIIMKTPGISLKDINIDEIRDKITSQTSLFIKYGSEKIIGVTGTKGKSTTSSLLFHMLKQAGKMVELVGNIGIPAFDMLDKEKDIEYFVYELSAHQLQFIERAPHISVILNLFEEHLDHFGTYEKYKEAKLNIFKYQEKEDIAIYGETVEYEVKSNIISNKILVSMNREQDMNYTTLKDEYIYSVFNENEINIKFPDEAELCGTHNVYNSMIAITVANILEIDEKNIINSLKTFKALPHRLQKIGIYNNITYVDDSISTIPEATIQAIETIKDVDVVLIGGMDRGIDYTKLIEYIKKNADIKYVLMYETGKRIYNEVKNIESVVYIEELKEAVNYAKENTEKRKVCLLSPAAASYGYFKNFEERGDMFKKYVEEN